MKDYNVWFTDVDGSGNHKILTAKSAEDIIAYMKDAGFSDIEVSPRN